MHDIKNYRWYQCDIIKKDGKREYWFRFIAVSQEEAESKVNNRLKRELTGSLKNWIYQQIAKKFIQNFHIFRVPECVLSQYNFLKSGETDAFYRREKG